MIGEVVIAVTQTVGARVGSIQPNRPVRVVETGDKRQSRRGGRQTPGKASPVTAPQGSAP